MQKEQQEPEQKPKPKPKPKYFLTIAIRKKCGWCQRSLPCSMFPPASIGTESNLEQRCDDCRIGQPKEVTAHLLQHIKKEQKCTQCGYCNHKALDYAHFSRDEKARGIDGRTMSILQCPARNVVGELLKTRLLCKVCHTLETIEENAQEFGLVKPSETECCVNEHKQKAKTCSDCHFEVSEQNIRAFYFDYINRKIGQETIQDLCKTSISINLLREVLKNSILRCANCYYLRTQQLIRDAKPPETRQEKEAKEVKEIEAKTRRNKRKNQQTIVMTVTSFDPDIPDPENPLIRKKIPDIIQDQTSRIEKEKEKKQKNIKMEPPQKKTKTKLTKEQIAERKQQRTERIKNRELDKAEKRKARQAKREQKEKQKEERAQYQIEKKGFLEKEYNDLLDRQEKEISLGETKKETLSKEEEIEKIDQKSIDEDIVRRWNNKKKKEFKIFHFRSPLKTNKKYKQKTRRQKIESPPREKDPDWFQDFGQKQDKEWSSDSGLKEGGTEKDNYWSSVASRKRNEAKPYKRQKKIEPPVEKDPDWFYDFGQIKEKEKKEEAELDKLVLEKHPLFHLCSKTVQDAIRATYKKTK